MSEREDDDDDDEEIPRECLGETGAMTNVGDEGKGEKSIESVHTYVLTRVARHRNTRVRNQISSVDREFRETSGVRVDSRERRISVHATRLRPLSFSLARRTPTSSLALAHTAGKTRGKFTTGGMNISGVLTSRAGSNVSDEEGVNEREKEGEMMRVPRE